jgi:hypothetical protein
MMAPRYPASKPSQKPGRPKIDWDPWLEKMHDRVLEGETDRRASELVARVYRHEIPQGSRHGQRSDASTARLLRKYYPPWLKRKAELEEMHAKIARISAMLGEGGSQWGLTDVFDTPEFQRAAEAGRLMADRIEKSIPLLESKLGKGFLDAPGWGGNSSGPSFATVIKSQKRGK